MKKLPFNVYKSGENCKYNVFEWHKVDGYCKECCPAGFVETNEEIQERRNSKGYR